MSREFEPVIPLEHRLRELAQLLDEYASSDAEDIDEHTRALFDALGPERLFDLVAVAFPLLPQGERERFLRIAVIRHHGLVRDAGRGAGEGR